MPPFGTFSGSDFFVFVPTTYGALTSGTPVFAFEGLAIGLLGGAEDVDALHFDSRQHMILSTTGPYSAAGGSGEGEDLSRYVGTYGLPTVGIIALLHDLSGLGVTTGVDGVSIKEF
jgi:hypothetical protein